MRESVRMIVVLTLISMVSAGILSQVYNYTFSIIQANLARELEVSIFQVLPGTQSVRSIDTGASTFVEDDRSSLRAQEGDIPLSLFEALDEKEQPIGFAYVGEDSGYAGIIKVLVGVDVVTNRITGIKILEHVETPGLGSRIEQINFRSQFEGKTINDSIALGQDIDNITGATVSARAVTDAVRNGFSRATQVYKGER